MTRKAGPAEPVHVQLRLAENGDALPNQVQMRINGRALGPVSIDNNALGALSPAQTAELLAALPKNARLSWTAKGATWTVSNQGVNAVLLKMDEFQGRLGTPGALIRKGTKPESSVLPPSPAPEMTPVRVPSDPVTRKPIPIAQRDALLAEIGKTVNKDTMAANSCEAFKNNAAQPAKLRVHRLSASYMLVSTTCWTAAYNSGDGHWLVNTQAPFAPIFITNAGTEYDHGTIYSTQRGRGIGDCISSDIWTWDGRQFVHTSAVTTGMCKDIAPGGAWELPALVVKLKKTN